MTITIAIIGVATVVAAASVVVEYKKHVQMRRMNDLLAESLGHEPDMNGSNPFSIRNMAKGASKDAMENLMQRAGYSRTVDGQANAA